MACERWTSLSVNTDDCTAASARSSERPRAATLAAAITLLVVSVGNAAAEAFPFAARTRNVNDLGNQYVPPGLLLRQHPTRFHPASPEKHEDVTARGAGGLAVRR